MMTAATFYAGRSVLITGATGFIGSALIRRLLELQSRPLGLYHQKPPTLSHPALNWAQCELDSGEQLAAVFAAHAPQIVFHLAGTRGGRGTEHARLQTTIETNLRLTHTLLEASHKHGVQAFVQAGSSEEYGLVPAPFFENHGVHPESAYGVSKLSATLLTQQYARACSFNACSARIFMAYGPGQGLDFFLPQLFQAWSSGSVLAMSPGEQTRDFVWIEDCIEALLRLGAHTQLEGTVVNVCTGTETSLRDVIELLHRLSGKAAQVQLGALPYRSREMMRNVGDTTWLRELTGFVPQTTLQEGMTRVLASL